MQVKSIAECSNGCILIYFRPSLIYRLPLRHVFCLFLSGRLRRILQKQYTSDLIKKSHGIYDLFIGCKHRTKITHKFSKFNENSMEAKSLQNFYNKAAIVVISSKLSLRSILFQDLVQNVTKWLIIIHYFRFMFCKAFTLSNNNLAHFHH